MALELLGWQLGASVSGPGARAVLLLEEAWPAPHATAHWPPLNAPLQ